MAFLVDANSTATSLMRASEHCSFGVLRHLDPLLGSLISTGTNITPLGVSGLRTGPLHRRRGDHGGGPASRHQPGHPRHGGPRCTPAGSWGEKVPGLGDNPARSAPRLRHEKRTAYAPMRATVRGSR